MNIAKYHKQIEFWTFKDLLLGTLTLNYDPHNFLCHKASMCDTLSCSAHYLDYSMLNVPMLTLPLTTLGHGFGGYERLEFTSASGYFPWEDIYNYMKNFYSDLALLIKEVHTK